MCLLKKRYLFTKQFIKRSATRKFIEFFGLSTSKDILNGATIISITRNTIISTYNESSNAKNLLRIQRTSTFELEQSEKPIFKFIMSCGDGRVELDES